MRIQLVIDGATTEQVRNLTLAWGRTVRTTDHPLPASNLTEPTVGIDGIAMRWTSPHLNQEQVGQFFHSLDSIEESRLEAKVNQTDGAGDVPVAHDKAGRAIYGDGCVGEHFLSHACALH